MTEEKTPVMHAFVEWLCPHAGIVRVGPEARQYGDQFTYAVAFRVAEKIALIKALVATGFNVSYSRPIIAALRADGYASVWERCRAFDLEPRTVRA